MRVIAVGVDHTGEAFQKRDGVVVAAAWGADARVNQAFTINGLRWLDEYQKALATGRDRFPNEPRYVCGNWW